MENATSRRLDPAREQAILDATLELLAETGYDRMSVDQIARRAGASKATIYRRWTGKADLVVDLVCNRLDIDLPPAPDTGSLRGDLLAALGAICSAIGHRHQLIIGLVSAMLSSPELAGAVRDHMPGRDLSGLEFLLGRAVERGDLPGPVDPRALFSVAEGLIWRRLIVLGEPLDDVFMADAVDRVLLPLAESWSGSMET
ncbi:TetR/AcrR family transcriptional regulator [Microtetraspora malaysiensis]|uniref:TetR/AcrR family transcriptional regulator n=1 Tax=Microtetraspora malaysiensis TaxID=161358 RepID=A0ABW6SP21_9ACTN